MAEKDVIMRVQNLVKEFPLADGSVLKAVNDVSFDVRRGETLAIVGESGCGKSTMVKTIMGLLEPTSGAVFFQDTDVTKLRGEERRQSYRHIQMVFQDPTAAFNPKMKIRDIICEPLKNFGLIQSNEVDAKARELLALVDLPGDFADRFPNNMSGGQRQRVAIARALALEPEVIICDEATSALDVSVQETIVELLVKLQKEKGVTYLFICHDLALVHLFCHRAVVMYKGQIVERLDGDKLLEAKEPYTRQLLDAVFTIEGRHGGHTA